MGRKQLEEHGDTVTEEEEGEDEQSSDEPPSMCLKSYKEAILALEDTQQFLLYQGHTKEAMDIGSKLYRNTQKQSTLDQFFQ